MKQHSSTVAPALALVSETGASSLPDPRERLAALVALGLERCPAPLVARRMGRGVSTVYGWTQPGLVGGLRALDLLTAPRPFARVVVRGLGAALDGAPPPDGPSRCSLAAVLARVAGVLILADRDDPERLSDELLRERLAAIEDSAAALEAQRQRYEGEILKRRIEAARRATKGEG